LLHLNSNFIPEQELQFSEVLEELGQTWDYSRSGDFEEYGCCQRSGTTTDLGNWLNGKLVMYLG
jgi:hypothetical protein